MSRTVSLQATTGSNGTSQQHSDRIRSDQLRQDEVTNTLFAFCDALAKAVLTALPEPLPLQPTVTSYAPGRVTVDLSAPAPAASALVVSENYFPGWSAMVDGKPASVARANFNLMGVPLPAGARRVELTFDDAAYHSGARVTLAALALTLIAIVGGLGADRLRRA